MGATDEGQNPNASLSSWSSDALAAKPANGIGVVHPKGRRRDYRRRIGPAVPGCRFYQ